MKLKEIFSELNPGNDVYTYVCNKVNSNEQIVEVENVLKYVYVSESFLNEVANGGLEQFYDNSSGILMPYLEETFKEIGSKELLSIIVKANEIIKNIEIRINDTIVDNIEHITDKESDKLNEYTKEINMIIDSEFNKIDKYVLKHKNDEIRDDIEVIEKNKKLKELEKNMSDFEMFEKLTIEWNLANGKNSFQISNKIFERLSKCFENIVKNDKIKEFLKFLDSNDNIFVKYEGLVFLGNKGYFVKECIRKIKKVHSKITKEHKQINPMFGFGYDYLIDRWKKQLKEKND